MGVSPGRALGLAIVLVALLSVNAPALGHRSSVILLEDPPGDVAGRPVSTPATEPLDILSLSVVEETAEQFVLALQVAHLQAGSPSAPTLNSIRYTIEFSALEGVVHYTLDLQGTAVAMPDGSIGAYFPSSNLDLVVAKDEQISQQDPGTFSIQSDNVLRFEIPTPSLAGQFPLSGKPPFHIPLRSGATFDDFRVYSQGAGEDVAPDEGESESYSLRTNLPGSLLQVYVAVANQTLPIQPSAKQNVVFLVTNLSPDRREIALSYVMKGDEALAQTIKVHGPRNILLPGETTRAYQVELSTGAADIPSGVVRLLIQGLHLESGDLGIGQAKLVAGFSLTPERSALYLAAKTNATITCSTCFDGWLTADPDDPDRNAGQRVTYNPDQRLLFGGTRERLADPALIGAPSRAYLNLRARATTHELADVEIVVDLMTGEHGGRRVVEFQEPATLTTEWSDFNLSAPIQASIMEPGWGFWLYSLFRSSPDQVLPSAAQIEVDPSRSRIVFPVQPLPDDLKSKGPPSPFQVLPLSDTQDFVNPGKHHLFRMSVTNIDAALQRVRLETQWNDTRWAVEILPGDEFALPAGDSITPAVRVRAPVDATEGERVAIAVRAVADDGSYREQSFRLTAVTAVDIPEANTTYQPVPGDLEKMVESRGGTPGFLASSVLAVWAWLGRSRRTLGRRACSGVPSRP